MTSTESIQSVQHKRSILLTILLVLMLIVDPIAAFRIFFIGASVGHSLPTMPEWITPVRGLLCIANFVCALAVWKWKKWGIFGLAASGIIALIFNILYNSISDILLGLLGTVLLVLLVRPVWNQME